MKQIAEMYVSWQVIASAFNLIDKDWAFVVALAIGAVIITVEQWR